MDRQDLRASSRGRMTYSTWGTGSFEHSVCSTCSTSKWFSIRAPTNHLLRKTYSHDRPPLQTLPWSPLWHFQVFTVVTSIEGKQQTEPFTRLGFPELGKQVCDIRKSFFFFFTTAVRAELDSNRTVFKRCLGVVYWIRAIGRNKLLKLNKQKKVEVLRGI